MALDSKSTTLLSKFEMVSDYGESTIDTLLKASSEFVLIGSDDLLASKYLESELKSEQKCTTVLEQMLQDANKKIAELEKSNSELSALVSESKKIQSENELLKLENQKLQKEVLSLQSKEISYWKQNFQNAQAYNERFQKFYGGVRTHDPNLHFFAYSSGETPSGLL